MNMLTNSGISRCLNFYSIQDNQKPDELGEDKDFFVGSNVHITLTIPNGETIRVRDIVVLGKLTIQSTNMEDTSTKGSLIARDIFVRENCFRKAVNLTAGRISISSLRNFFFRITIADK